MWRVERHLPFNILNIPPPNLHCFCSRAMTRLEIRHSRAFLQPPNIQILIARRLHPAFHTPHSPLRKAIFRTSIHGLSHLDDLPFEARKLSYRGSKDAQRHGRLSIFGVSPLPFRFFARYFAPKSDTCFSPNILINFFPLIAVV